MKEVEWGDTQDILRLQIPIHDIQLMQMRERKKKLGSIEPRAPLVKLLLALQVVEQLSTVDVRQH